MQKGDLAPDFKLDDQNGNERTLSTMLLNGPVVLFFYPAAKMCIRDSCTPGRGDEYRSPVAKCEGGQPALGSHRAAQRILARPLVSFGRQLQCGGRVQRELWKRPGPVVE